VGLQHGAGAVRASFDDPNLVSSAGLEPVMRLAQSCDLHGVVRRRLHVPTDKGSNAAGKVATIVAGMLTGADSIDDLDVVRHGGMPQLFGGVYAPSTLGEFLRAFTHGHVRQLQAVSRQFLVHLAATAPVLPGAAAVTFVDVDSLLRRVYGKQKQGAGFGHAKVGGYQVICALGAPEPSWLPLDAHLPEGGGVADTGGLEAAHVLVPANAGLGVRAVESVRHAALLRADEPLHEQDVVAVHRRPGQAQCPRTGLARLRRHRLVRGCPGSRRRGLRGRDGSLG
jgi:hypothetical protein